MTTRRIGMEWWMSAGKLFSARRRERRLGRKFDCVTMFHSLEHLFCPETALIEAYRVLKPTRKILIEVPRFNSYYSRWFREKWFHLEVPRHLYHFEDHTLSALLEKAGFRVLSVHKHGIVQLPQFKPGDPKGQVFVEFVTRTP